MIIASSTQASPRAQRDATSGVEARVNALTSLRLSLLRPDLSLSSGTRALGTQIGRTCVHDDNDDEKRRRAGTAGRWQHRHWVPGSSPPPLAPTTRSRLISAAERLPVTREQVAHDSRTTESSPRVERTVRGERGGGRDALMIISRGEYIMRQKSKINSEGEYI